MTLRSTIDNDASGSVNSVSPWHFTKRAFLAFFGLACLAIPAFTSGPFVVVAAPGPESPASHIMNPEGTSQNGMKTTAFPSSSIDLDWRTIDERLAYDGDDLGCTFRDGRAHLKLWAPKATLVSVLLFDAIDQTREIGRWPLQQSVRGVWEIILEPGMVPGVPTLRGAFYQFEVTNPGREARRVLDPYARSMAAVTVSPAGDDAGASGDFVGKAAIVDPAPLGPANLRHAHIPGYAKREDAIIWEVHVRDFTADPAIEGDLRARWGSYRAFIDKLPYIKSLGVTHVQLLPVMAWYYGDETRMNEREMQWSTRNNQYNWGYDPQHYFSPDGAYSEQPENPEARIFELKELIHAIHEAGMGVILDVVYTHMAKASFLEDIVPGYYFFQDSQGRLVGDFGNNLATTRKMAEKLMVDSVAYWFREYKIDGMRWDMMGDATAEAVQKAFDAAKAIHPQAIFIGEGWRTFKGHLEDPSLKGKAADQDWMDKTDSVGVFSDEFRNELKSGFGCEGDPMFITGGPRSIATIFKNLQAQPANTPADQPGDMVPYIEAHDNLPLYDVIAQSIKKDPDRPENDLEIHKRIRLGNTLLLTAQGTAFLHAGQEYGRTKQWRAPGKPEQKFHTLANADESPFAFPYFVHDSYDASDAVNRFDWAKATDPKAFPVNQATRAYTVGLIALRRSSDAFRLGSLALVEKNVTRIAAPEIKEIDLVIAYRCRGTGGEAFSIFINADRVARVLTIGEDLTAGVLIADGAEVNLAGVEKPVGVALTAQRITLDPLTAAIIRHP
jgi:pullulanase